LFGIENYQSFLLAVLVFQLVPGPGTIAILNATASNGVRSGLKAVTGTLAGDFIFMAAAVAGLAAVLKANIMLLQVLQWFGAAYLCWSGIRLMLSKAEEGGSGSAPPPEWIHFKQALAVSLTNPKVVLFFVAFFPLFLSAGSSLGTLVALMAHVTLISLLYQIALVLVGNELASRLRRMPTVRTAAKRLAGVAMIAFGARLALNSR
jgi:threonine/homoserine/homoserine lactone efflux protein